MIILYWYCIQQNNQYIHVIPTRNTDKILSAERSVEDFTTNIYTGKHQRTLLGEISSTCVYWTVSMLILNSSQKAKHNPKANPKG